MLERYYYSPYGELEAVVDAHPFDYVLDTTPTAARFDRLAIGELRSRRRVKDDGVVDDFDLAAVTTGGDCWNDYDGAGGACKRLDANADREIDADDYNAIEAYVNILPADGDLQRTPISPRSLRGNPFGHQGLVLDAEIGSYQNRARELHALSFRFFQRERAAREPNAHRGYPDGMSLYSCEGVNPTSWRDPFGTTAFQGCTTAQRSKAQQALNTGCACIATANQAAQQGTDSPADCIKSAIACMQAKCTDDDPIHIHCDNLSCFCKN